MPAVRPHSLPVQTVHKASWYPLKAPHSIMILGLSLAMWVHPTLSLAQTAQPMTVQQGIAPTSLAHATLTQKELDELSGNTPSSQTVPDHSSPAASAPVPNDGGTPEVLDTSASRGPDNQTSMNTGRTTPLPLGQDLSPTAPISQDQPAAAPMSAPTNPAPTLAATPMPPTTATPVAPSPALSAPPSAPSSVPSGPLSMAHATLEGNEIPPSSFDNGQATSTSNAQAIADANKDLVAAQKLENPANNDLVTDIAKDNAKETARANQAAQVPGEVEAVKQETNAELNQPLQASSVANSSDIDPKILQSWSDKLEILERENIALRDKLQLKDTDKLSDIKVDAVAQIHENVLRDRVAELEKELDKLHMQQDPNNATDSPKADDLAKAVKDALPPPPPAGKAGPTGAAP